MFERDTSIEFLSDCEDAAWQQYVDAHPEGTLFHGLAWKRAVQRAFGHRPRYLLARRDERIVGVLPLFEVRSLLAGRLLVSVPYATYGGVLAADDATSLLLLRSAVHCGRRLSARCIELRSVCAADGTAPVCRTHATFRRPLPCRAEDILSSFPRKTRAAARRAEERFGLEPAFGHRWLKTVWTLYARSMRRLGSPNYPFRFFKELVSATGYDNCVQVVRHRGQAVAGLVTFFYRRTAMPYFVGVNEQADIYGLSNFLYWQSMMRAVELGCQVYDFGRTRLDNRGPFEFKRSFGFEPQTLEYQTIEMPGCGAPDLAPGSPRWAAARRIWKVLPLPVTRPLGAWLARSIPG